MLETKNRLQYLESICKGKTVLHCGALEGEDTRTISQLSNNWLHARLKKSAKKVIGIDIVSDEDNNIFSLDLEDAYEFRRFAYSYVQYDYIILGEVIEHLFNPGIVLDNLKLISGELIITTPNAYSIRKFIYALFGREVVSTSHTCYYSFKTLEYLLKKHGYEVLKKETYSYLGRFGFIQKAFYKLFPLLTDGIIVHAKKTY